MSSRGINGRENSTSSAAKHHELEDRLHELTAKHYLSEPEQLEEVTLKKRKLQIKDRMEDILRRHRAADALRAAAVSGGCRHVAGLAPRGCQRARSSGRRLLRIDPAGCRSSSAPCSWRWSAGVSGGVVVRVPAARSRRPVPVLLPRSRSSRPPPASATSCCRRPTGGCWSPGRGAGGRRAARRRGSRSASSSRRWTCTSTAFRRRGASRGSPSRPGRFLPAYRHDAAARTSAARSGSITTARRSSRGRSSASSRGASCAALQAGDAGARRRSLRGHEIRLAHGRVPAADRRDPGHGRADRCAAGETVIAVLH